MAKARHIKKKQQAQMEGQIMAASSFGSKEFSRAYDQCASGELADNYRSYAYDCDHNIPSSIIKDRFEHLAKLFRTDEIARKIINLPPIDALSNWRDSEYPWESELGAPIVVQRATRFARSYGCSVVLPIIKNSNGNIVAPSRSLDSLIASGETFTIDKLIYSEANLKFEAELESDFYKPWFGFPKQIKIGDRIVHPSRVAFFGNVIEPFFMSIKGDLSDYHESLRRLSIAVRRNTGIVLSSDFGKIQQFIQARKEVGAAAPSIKEITQERARSLYENINDVNVAVINGTEDIKFYQQTNIKDLIENVGLQMQILSGVSDMPLSRLFGKLQSSGMNNNSQTEFLNYDQSLDSWRVDFVNPGLAQLDLIMNTINRVETSNWSWNPTKAEELRVTLTGGNDTGGDS